MKSLPSLLLLVALGASSCADESRQAGASAQPVEYEGRWGTGDATAFGQHGSLVAATLERRSDGRYLAWTLDLTNGKWRRASWSAFNFPLAIGVDERGRVAVADAVPGRCVLRVIGPGADPSIDLPGTPRTIVADGDGGWYVGGMFVIAGNRFVACHVNASGSVTPLPGARVPRDRDTTRMDFTGLALADRELLVSSPLLAEIRAVNATDDDARTWADLTVALPEFRHSGAGDPLSPFADHDATLEWGRVRDVPMRLDRGEDGVHLVIRRKSLGQWAIASFSDDGTLLGTHSVPWDWLPVGWHGQSVLVRRKDLERPGEPVRLQLLDPRAAAPSPAGGSPPVPP